MFILDEEKAIKNIYFDATKRLNLLQESYFIYDRSSLVKTSYINELNKFLPIYCSVSNFSEKKGKKSKIISAKNQKRFFIGKPVKRSELSLEIAKVSGKPIETTDKKVHNIQLAKIGRKRKTGMVTIDFVNIRGQQNFEQEAVINPIEIKIENDRIQNMFDKYKKNAVKNILGGLLFSSAIKNDTEKIFIVVGGLVDAKYSIINGKIYQTIGVINASEIENWDEIKKSSRWVNVEFQSQGENREATHFPYNFMTKNVGDVLNFSIKLIDDKNSDIEFEAGEKKISNSRIYDRIFSMNKLNKKPKKQENNTLKKFLLSLKRTWQIFS